MRKAVYCNNNTAQQVNKFLLLLFLLCRIRIKIEGVYKSYIVKNTNTKKYKLSWEHFGEELGESWENEKKRSKKIKEYGYCFHHHGGDHDAYSNVKRMERIPRHKEVDEDLAKSIIKRCKP